MLRSPANPLNRLHCPVEYVLGRRYRCYPTAGRGQVVASSDSVSVNGVNQKIVDPEKTPGLDNISLYTIFSDVDKINGLDLSDTSDGPALKVEDASNELTVSDSFGMYLLFEPSGPTDNPNSNSIPVPMQVLNWKFSGTVERFSSGLKLMIESPSETTLIVGGKTNSYPTSDRVVQNTGNLSK